jgi:methionine-rich copper-binding protein CopC
VKKLLLSASAAVRLVTAVLVAAAFVLFPAAGAQAHDELLSHTPEDGATVETMPEELTLTFSNVPVALGSVVQIQDSSGTNWADGEVQITDTEVSQPIKADAPAGEYSVVWRVVSSDAHPIEGNFSFTVESGAEGTEGASAGAGADAGAGTPEPIETQENPADEPAGFTVAGQTVPWSVLGMVAVLVVLAVVIGVTAKRRLGKGGE